jgi:uncharacterized protein (TIGR02145 family)
MNKLLSVKLFILLLTVHYSLLTVHSFSQGVGINNTGVSANSSAMLDISSTTQGILIPRMSDAQRNAIPSPAAGLLIYNSTTNKFNYYKSTGWYELSRSSKSAVTGNNSPGGGIAINETSAIADKSAVLEINSATRGFLLPRTTQGSLTPIEGLIYYDNSMNRLRYYDGNTWKTVCETYKTNITGAGSLTSVGVAVNITGDIADPSAMLDVKATNQGLLIPGLTSAQTGQIKPVNGLIVYNTETNTIDYYNGIDWGQLDTGGPNSPSAGTNSVTAQQVIWNWNSVSGASGYKWNLVNNFGSAIDNGSKTSYTQSGLLCNTSYTLYVWAYNGCGNSNAATLLQNTSACISCNGTFTDSRDGKTYRSVQIGSQCWMADNLNYGTYVPAHASPQQPNEKYCQNASETNDPTCPFGGLYDWLRVINGPGYTGCNGTANHPACNSPVQGICPSGWHVPSHYEWTLLERTVGSSPGSFPYDEITVTSSPAAGLGVDEGSALKEAGTIHWKSPNNCTPPGSCNSSGFTATPGGFSWQASFGYGGSLGYWWTSSGSKNSGNIYSGWVHSLQYNTPQVNRWFNEWYNGFSLRCVKN